MKQLNEMFDGDELSIYFARETVNEGVIGDFFKKTWNYIKGKIAKIGDFFVALFNDKVLPSITPVTSQYALLKTNVRDTACVHWVGNSEDAKFSGVDTKGTALLASYPSTIEAWTEAAKRKGSANESLISKSLNQILEALKLASDDKQVRNIDESELEHLVEIVIRKGSKAQPLLIWGAPGVGKTAIVNKVLKKIQGENSRMLDMQLSMKEHDDFFLPSYSVNKDKAVDLPKSYLPVWEDLDSMTDEERKAADEACGTGLLFLDELSRAKPQVQDVCLKLVNERKLGDKYKLGSGWSIIAASNRFEDDQESQFRLSSALGNRFRQVNYSPTCKSWRKWADKQGYMNQHILDWLEQNEKYFYFQDNDETTLYATPRAWELACQALANEFWTADEEGFDLLALPDSTIMSCIQDCVGFTAANAFMEYVKTMRSIDINDLKKVLTNPDKAPLPEKQGNTYKPDVLYIITTTIISFITEEPSAETYENLVKYFVRLKSESAAGKMQTMLTRKFPNMNTQFGEQSGDGWGDKYAKGLQMLIDAYPEWENADFS